MLDVADLAVIVVARVGGRAEECACHHVRIKLLDNAGEMDHGIRRTLVKGAVEVEDVAALVYIEELTDIRAVGGDSGSRQVRERCLVSYIVINAVEGVSCINVGDLRVVDRHAVVAPRLLQSLVGLIFCAEIARKMLHKRRREVAVNAIVLGILLDALESSRVAVGDLRIIEEGREIVPLARSARRKEIADNSVGVGRCLDEVVYLGERGGCVTSPLLGAE